MNQTLDVLNLVSMTTFTALAILAGYRLVQRPVPARAWLAATFATLAAVTIVGRFLPDDRYSPSLDLARKALVAVLLLFPYCLYRFGATFRQPGRITNLLAGALTALACLLPFAFGRFPLTGEPRSSNLMAYVVLVVVQWALLSGFVAFWLWAAGSGQPTVARRRMRTLSLGAAGMAVAIVISGATPSSRQANMAQIVVSLIAIGTGPLFLLGFSPPRLVLATWRRPEEIELRRAEAGLMAAMTPEEVAAVLAPHVARVMGAHGAVISDGSGRVLASVGVSETETRDLLVENPRQDQVLTIPLGEGRVSVMASPYMPYFAREETEILEQLARLTEVALQRSRLSVRERALASELRQANDAMREFVAIASHDLRTPVTLVTGFASMTADNFDTLPDSTKRENLEAIARQGRHLSRLVDDLLTVSKIDADALAPLPEELDVRQAIDAAVAEFEGEAITTSVDPGLTVIADPDHLSRMLRNYLSNAVKYGQPPVAVEARAVALPLPSVEVRVSDRGEGIAPEFRERLFQRFARHDDARDLDRRGTGLGLSIVRGLARAAEGDAWFEPNEPSGSCFVLRLPR